MIYFDTDVLVNALVAQDLEKHRQSSELIERAGASDTAIISNLSVQEALFVIDRIGINSQDFNEACDTLMRMRPIAYTLEDLQRGIELARQVGFRNINDCIHTAIAESHCTELVTYNRQDFRQISGTTALRITIL